MPDLSVCCPIRPDVTKRPRAFTRWTSDEDQRLEQLFRAGVPRAEIVRQLDRHDGAISRRLVKLGLVAETEEAAAISGRGRRRSPQPGATSSSDQVHLELDAAPHRAQSEPSVAVVP